MMVELVTSILYPIIIIALSIFIIFRLKVGRTKDAAGGGYIYAGLILIFISSMINLLTQHPEYSFWFLDSVYSFITLSIFLFLIIGVVLFLIGLALFFSFWGDRDIEVTNHLEKLRLLDNIQRESRFPHPLPELLDRSLKSILTGLGEEAGAVFMLNRSQRKFVLVTGVGLTKEEIALLEYYPYGRNIVTQAIEDESPMISSDFRSLGGKAQLAVSKFRSILVIPLISGRNRLGALLFFSTEERHYSKEFISVISPVTEWLSEKIEVNRLTRDLNKTSNTVEVKSHQFENFLKRMGRILKFGGEIPTPSEYAERCKGMADSDEVWLLGLVNGKLNFYGGSESDTDLSDNFKTAVINALSRNKAVILNQESTDEDGKSFIAQSSLLLPVDGRKNAIIFRRNNGAVSVGDEELKALEIIADVAGMVIRGAIARSVNISRNRGIESIAGVLRMKISKKQPAKDIRNFMENISAIIPRNYLLILYRREGDRFKVQSSNDENDLFDEISIAIGEGSTGRTAALRTDTAFFDTKTVAENLALYDEENRNVLYRLFDDRKTPVFQGDYPVIINRNVEFVITLFGFKESPSENMEQHRLISLLAALLNLRIEITFADKSDVSAIPVKSDGIVFSEKINDINNNLSVMSGYCQLARRDPDLSSEAIKAFNSILGLTEDVAESLDQFISERYNQETDSAKLTDSNGTIKDIFIKNSISGNLHMIAGKPYAVNLNLNEAPTPDVRQIDFSRFINNVAQTFAKNVEEDEIITISTYSRNEFFYIDMSKHRDNFPPVEMVARFGNYAYPRTIDNRMRDSEFLKLLEVFSGEFAFDKHSRTPSYYSFRIPLYGKTSPSITDVAREKPNILAVDDQAVILDLLVGMCQSLGYKILTARDGEEGLKVFEKHRPDVVITDLAMPRMSGRELASRIKAISPETPVILITGWGVAVDEDKMKRSGIDYILRKPFRLEQLSELISKVRFSDINL